MKYKLPKQQQKESFEELNLIRINKWITLKIYYT